MAILDISMELYGVAQEPLEECKFLADTLKENAQPLNIGCGKCPLTFEIISEMKMAMVGEIHKDKMCNECYTDLKRFIES